MVVWARLGKFVEKLYNRKIIHAPTKNCMKIKHKEKKEAVEQQVRESQEE